MIKKILLFLSFLNLTSCFDSKDENRWIVATSADNPPYEFIKNGEIVGFDIDLVREIASHLGKEVEIRNMEFHGIVAALTSHNVDIAIAGMSITPERKKRIDFSLPYTSANIAILYKKSEGKINIEDLAGKTVGAQLGTIWGLVAHDLAVQYGYKTRSLASNLMLIEEMKNGRIDAMILEESQVEKFKQIYPEFDSIKVKTYASSLAIALPKQSKHKKDIDHTIKMLRNNGVLSQLEQKWGVIDIN